MSIPRPAGWRPRTPSFNFRSLDCMACGTAVMVNHVEHADVARCWDADLVPDEHYVAYDGEDFTEIARELLADPERRARIGAKAARVVRERHTWKHRAERILRDLSHA